MSSASYSPWFRSISGASNTARKAVRAAALVKDSVALIANGTCAAEPAKSKVAWSARMVNRHATGRSASRPGRSPSMWSVKVQDPSGRAATTERT